MQILKNIILILILLICTYIGIDKSRSFKKREIELKKIKSALNIFKTKINYTYETIGEIFKEISNLEYKGEKNIFLDLKSNSKREFLQDLTQRASNVCKIDTSVLFDTVMERENLGSTGFGNGTALPHGRFAELSDISIFFARPTYPIDFDSIDKKPVDIVFLLVSPESAGADHLTALAFLSRKLKDENICKKLRQMNSESEIYALLCEP